MSAGDSIVGTHGTPSRNPRLCAGCHVSRYTATDKATGAFVFQATGHRVIAAPCVDANGVPTTSQNCAITSKTFRSCVNAACHASEAVARNLYLTDSARVQQLVASVNSSIAKVTALKPADCKLGGTTFTTCLGAQFNVSLALSPGNVIHNPFLIERLLVASLAQIQKEYGVTASVSLTPQFVLPPRHR